MCDKVTYNWPAMQIAGRVIILYTDILCTFAGLDMTIL